MLKLKLSQYQFGRYDYGRLITCSIFDENGTAFNVTGYTAVVKILNKNNVQIVANLPVTWVTQASGIGTFAFTITDRISTDGLGFVVLQVSKSGEQTSTYPVTISVPEIPN